MDCRSPTDLRRGHGGLAEQLPQAYRMGRCAHRWTHPARERRYDESVRGDSYSAGQSHTRQQIKCTRQRTVEDLSNALLKGWCREGESNPHNPFGSADFKSAASASFAIPALVLSN